jgi:hypothetical protein
MTCSTSNGCVDQSFFQVFFRFLSRQVIDNCRKLFELVLLAHYREQALGKTIGTKIVRLEARFVDVPGERTGRPARLF